MTKKTKEELLAEIGRVFPEPYAMDMVSTPEQVLWYVQQLQNIYGHPDQRIKEILKDWAIHSWHLIPIPSDGVIKNRHELVRGVGLPLIGLPPYSPELNPAERVFEEVRRWIEGKVYPSLEDKVAAVAAYLTELESNPDRVRGLASWDWIEDAIQRLPARNAA